VEGKGRNHLLLNVKVTEEERNSFLSTKEEGKGKAFLIFEKKDRVAPTGGPSYQKKETGIRGVRGEKEKKPALLIPSLY